MASTAVVASLNAASVGSSVLVKGWVRSIRSHRKRAFVDLNDGSSHKSLQVVMCPSVAKSLTVGTSIAVSGNVTSFKSSEVELQAVDTTVLGKCDANDYPMQKKYHSLEFLRENLHLRPRTSTFASVARIRNTLSSSIHNSFQSRDFIQMHSPILTTNDAEGAGEQFRVVGGATEFFSDPAFLTVSGQLHAETYACALSKVYTFGPTFRAENSNTARHLAEFWMVEPEVAFADLNDIIALASDVVTESVKSVLNNRLDDVVFLQESQDSSIIETLESVANPTGGNGSFARMTYSEAVETLRQKGGFAIEWGDDLSTENERYLAETFVKGPVFVTHYPASIKPFYMKRMMVDTKDEGTVNVAECVDLLVPRVGELIGGSVREDRYDVLEAQMIESGVSKDSLSWYLDLRKFGSVPHGGWGLGFERLVQLATGMSNIRDTIPMPRYPGSCRY